AGPVARAIARAVKRVATAPARTGGGVAHEALARDRGQNEQREEGGAHAPADCTEQASRERAAARAKSRILERSTLRREHGMLRWSDPPSAETKGGRERFPALAYSRRSTSQ